MEPTTTDAAAAADLEPLQQQQGPDGDVDDDQKHWWKDRNLWTRIWQGLAIASFAVNIAAMALEASAVAIVAGIVAVLIAPVVFYVQFKLQEEGTLRAVQNQLRKEVNRLQGENAQLTGNVNRLEGQVARLKVEESKLEKIAEQQGTSVDSFVGLLRENQTILDGLKRCVQGDAEQTFVSAILDSDWDQSNTFSDKEIKMLGIRMQNVPGVTFHQQNLEKRVKATDGSLSAIFKLLSEMDDNTIPDEERIFVIDSSHLTAKKY